MASFKNSPISSSSSSSQVHDEGPLRSFYRPELDALRFFAFFAVFVFHTVRYSVDHLVQHGVPQWAAQSGLALITAGMYGVDLFFVLSAYLITELLLREKDARGALNVRAFYMRRLLRIWPLYYFFIALVVLIPFLNPNHTFGLRYTLAFLILMSNWSLIVWGRPYSVAGPLWSVAVEEQFYLFWPPLVARLSRRQILFAAVTMIGVANFARAVAVATRVSRENWWLNTFAHLDSIAAGILLAVLLGGRRFSLKYGSRMMLISAALSCLIARAHFEVFTGRLPVVGTLIGDPAVALACASLLLGFIYLPLRSLVLQYLGKISYGLYVYHVTALWIFDKLLFKGQTGPAHAFMRFGCALGLTIAISAMSYRLLEKPFLNLKRRFTYVASRPV